MTWPVTPRIVSPSATPSFIAPAFALQAGLPHGDCDSLTAGHSYSGTLAAPAIVTTLTAIASYSGALTATPNC